MVNYPKIEYKGETYMIIRKDEEWYHLFGGYKVRKDDPAVKFKVEQNMNFEEPYIPEIKYPGKYEAVAQKIGQLVDEKNAAYGDAFNKAGEFLKIIYPDGIQPEQYGDMLALVRVFDKMMRIATDKDALGENPWNDITGYGILKSADDAG